MLLTVCPRPRDVCNRGAVFGLWVCVAVAMTVKLLWKCVAEMHNPMKLPSCDLLAM